MEILSLVILMVGITFNVLIIVGAWSKIKNKELQLAENRFISDLKYKDNGNDISKFLDEFIYNCMQDYVMYNIIPNTGIDYITKDMENQIRADMRNLVVNRLSDNVLKKITLCYSREYFEQTIAEKIFSIVTVFVADFNSGNNKIVEFPHTNTQKNNKQTESSQEEAFLNDW